MASFFITGIGTEVGKTVVSAFLCKALKADYWKPIQSGDLNHTDTHKVRDWAGLPDHCLHPEAYRLSVPASPHFSAQQAGINIELSAFQLPTTDNTLIIEGAGGLLVPLNDRETMLDLIKHFSVPVMLVASSYLGSINHTLLSLHLLKQQNIPLAGLIYSGPTYRDNVDIISRQSGIEPLLQLPEVSTVNYLQIDEWVTEFGELLRSKLA